MKRLALLLMLPLLAAACAAPQPVETPTVTASPSLPSAPSAIPPPTATLPPAPTATPPPIEGTLAIKVNVRSGPGTSYDSIGLLDAGEKILITGRLGGGDWYRILYPAAGDGIGWVASQYVRIPLWTQVPLLATPTPTGPTGRVLQRLNVRSGPGLAYDTLGMLEPDSVVYLTGKNSTASWFQIDYPAGPGGRAWVTAQYIQTEAAGLPVLDENGTPVAEGTPGTASTPVTPTPTVGPAPADGDSSTNPAVRVTFSASGTRQFTYSSQVSAPVGDPEDWLEFTPYSVIAADARLVFNLACSGNGTLSIQISQGGTLIPDWGTLACGDRDKIIVLPAGRALVLRLIPAPGQSLRLVEYVLTVRNEP